MTWEEGRKNNRIQQDACDTIAKVMKAAKNALTDEFAIQQMEYDQLHGVNSPEFVAYQNLVTNYLNHIAILQELDAGKLLAVGAAIPPPHLREQEAAKKSIDDDDELDDDELEEEEPQVAEAARVEETPAATPDIPVRADTSVTASSGALDQWTVSGPWAGNSSMPNSEEMSAHLAASRKWFTAGSRKASDKADIKSEEGEEESSKPGFDPNSAWE